MPRGRRDTHIRKVKPRSSRTPSRRAGDASAFPPTFLAPSRIKPDFWLNLSAPTGKPGRNFPTDRVRKKEERSLPLIEGLEITTLAAEGKAMGRYNDMVVFVPLTVPGDVVDVQIRNRRRRFMEGTVVRYIEKSPPACRTLLRALRRLRRMQMAEPPLPRTAPLQGGTGTRPAYPG